MEGNRWGRTLIAVENSSAKTNKHDSCSTEFLEHPGHEADRESHSGGRGRVN